MSFHCPRCDEKTTVMSTRANIRERRCLDCDHIFRTKEIEYDGKISYKNKLRSEEFIKETFEEAA